MFWFTQNAELDEEFANQAKVSTRARFTVIQLLVSFSIDLQVAIMLPSVGVYTAYGFAVFGVILLLVGGLLTANRSWNGYTQYHNDDELRL